jgi:ketosteroid isomerase-like protein
MKITRLNIRNASAILIAIVVAACSTGKKIDSSHQSFDGTLANHLDAIKNSDLARLDPTVADSVVVIGPGGDKMHSKKSFMKLHENWFKRTNWEWNGKFVRVASTDSMGYALIRYDYTEKDSVGSIQFQNRNFLVLIFKNSESGWQLVHDQNTGIPL